MKRAIYVLMSIIQLTLLAGMIALPLLDKKFMGVMRFLANKNRVLNAAPWTGGLSIAASVAMLVIVCWAIAVLLRHGTKVMKRHWILLAGFGFAAGTFLLFANTTIIRAYWFISIMVVATVFLQTTKCLLYGQTDNEQR